MTQTKSESSVDKRHQITEDAKLFSVLSHASMGIMGLFVMFGAFGSVRGNKFTGKQAVSSVVNGVITILALLLVDLAYKAIGQFTGPQTVYFIPQYGSMGLLVMFYGTAFWSAIQASKGKQANIIWVEPIVRRIFRD
ncbi:MAG: hypothetical protein KA140_05955 [Caldisericia bacterium]|nr:hypothetical protein [Caldisericia bacterium]